MPGSQMQPIPDPASLPSPDRVVAQSCKDPLQRRAAGSDGPDASVPDGTEARRGWPAFAGHDGGEAGHDGGEAGHDGGGARHDGGSARPDGRGAGHDGHGGDGAGVPRSGHPRGNPNLAPRCGAKARTTGLACRAPAMGNGRCRMHGGKSTGPRTEAGFARLAAAHTTHGRCGAAERAVDRYGRTLIVRSRLLCAAELVRAYLPRNLAARLELGPPDELTSPVHPSNLPSAVMADKT